MKHLVKLGLAAALAVASASSAALAQAPKTLDAVKARGTLSCGVGTGLAGFGQPDDKGAWTGLDVEFCRALAAAIFNDPQKVSFKPLSAKERFTALQSGEIDVLARNSTWTISRDSSLGLAFVATNYYDGQGFMVKKSLGVKSAKELKGASVCVQTGTTTELNLADFFRTNKLEYKPVVFEKNDEVVAAYDAGRCDSMTTDASGLYAERLRMKNPDENIVLPEIISKEPLAPAVRQGDQQWGDLCRWTLFALVNAEELGVSSRNADAMLNSQAPEIRRLLGKEGAFGAELGLTNDWAVRIIRHVGNYGEVYERNVGTGSKLGIPRGLNQLWNAGGILYAPPIR